MPPIPSETQWPVYRRTARTVVVVDVVESVRLMEQNEEDTVHRWQAFVGEVVTHLLPQHGGRLVKSLGDGLMLEFEAVPPAIQCAIAMQAAIAQGNQGRPADQWMCLRVGAHVADVIVDEHDIYGNGVNLAARLSALAAPGEIVVSADVRDRLTPGLDAEVEDLGECYLRHMAKPVGAFRISEVGDKPPSSLLASPAARSTRPTVAIIPFAQRDTNATMAFLGEALADDLIASVSRSHELQVTSRLSTTAFNGRVAPLSELRHFLGATYVLSGGYHASGARVRINAELADVRSGNIVWASAHEAGVQDILHGNDGFLQQVALAISTNILAQELHRARTLPMPSLEGFTLMLAAISLMHRASPQEFDQARAMLEYLADREPRAPEPNAWLAKWHVLRSVQGWTADPKTDAALALERVHRALDVDPQNSLALSVDGLIHGYMLKDLDGAAVRYQAALESNPNESLAWLFTSTLHSYRDEGPLAAAAAEQALHLSPLDPLRYFFDSLAATAVCLSGNYARSIELARRSLKVNRTHRSTHRILAIAQVLGGQVEDARKTAKELMLLEPTLTVRGFMERYPGRDSAHAGTYAQALQVAGVPP